MIATPLNYRYTAREIDHALEVSGARALLAHVERAEDVAASELAGGLELGTIAYRDAEPLPSGNEEPAGRRRRLAPATSPHLLDAEPLPPRDAARRPDGAGRDLLHLGQHRPGEGRHPHAARRCAG